MKRFAIAFSLMIATLVAGFAHAGNEGPQATPTVALPIAQVTLRGGFVPPTVPVYRSVDVMSDGRVVSVERYADRREIVKPVTVLSEEQLSKLVEKIEKVRAGKTYDAHPEEPMCMDAPGLEHSVTKATGERIVIALNIGCKQMARENAGRVDKEIVKILDTLKSLANK